MIQAIFFDLDQTLLDRTNSLKHFLNWQINFFQEHNFYALGLQEYFSTIVISEAVGLRKPDPAIFDLACKQLDVFTEQSVFIGDNESVDILGAQSFGMKTVFFHPNPQVNSDIADINLHDYRNLGEMLNQLAIKTTPENARQ